MANVQATTKEAPLPAVFALACMLAYTLGARDIGKRPGCWEHQVSAGWWVAINGSGDTRKDSEGRDVPPFSVAAYWYGWPAGIVTPTSGIIAAGSEASEDSLIAALREAIVRAGGDLPHDFDEVCDGR